MALGYKMVVFRGFLCAFVVEEWGVKSSRPPSVLEAICSMLPLACGVCLRGAGRAVRLQPVCSVDEGDLAEFEVAMLLVTHLQLYVVGGLGAYSSERPWCLGRQDRPPRSGGTTDQRAVHKSALPQTRGLRDA